MAGNTIVKQISEKQIFPNILGYVSSAVTFNQGDYLIFDPVNSLVRAATAEAEAASGLGIAALSISSGQPISPYQGTAVDAAQAAPAMNGPLYGDSALMVLKTGSTLALGAPVYLDIATGNQGVAASGTKAIGVYVGQSAITSSAAGLQVEVLIGARYPNDTLKF
jgi:hypothetical protein